jgi:hypothetical protein
MRTMAVVLAMFGVCAMPFAAAGDDACSSEETLLVPGEYRGEMQQSHWEPDTGKVTTSIVLAVTVDAGGCVTWQGASSITGNGFACMKSGVAELTRKGNALHFSGVAKRWSVGLPPVRYHVWDCPLIGHVEVDLDKDLRSRGCVQLGNSAGMYEANETAANGIVCRYDNIFGQLKDKTITVQKGGTLRMPFTVDSPTTLVLHRVDSRE